APPTLAQLAAAPPRQNGGNTTHADLPQSVQYALSAACMHCQMDYAALPVPILHGLREMGEAQACETVNVFQGCDMAVVKNKPAYLMGLIKKRLNK
ncbi:hypothetical protein TeGR_g11370, partial [Tetraparma gracilis]